MSRSSRDSGLTYTTDWRGRDGRVYDTVTIVWPKDLGRVLACGDTAVVKRHLRKLRASGVLLAPPGRLQSAVKLGDRRWRRGYVFACVPHQLPKPVVTGVRKRGRMRVFTA